MKNIFALMALLLILPLFVSCGVFTKAEPIYIDGFEFCVRFSDTTIKADQINSPPEDDNIVVYTKAYKVKDEYALTVTEDNENRVAFSIRYLNANGKVEFDIVERYDVVEAVKIPINGFVLTMPSALIEGVRANKGQIVRVDGYEHLENTYEQLNYATLAPDYLNALSARRINFVNPLVPFEPDKIYFIDDDYSGRKEVDIDNVIVKLSRVTNSSYNVVSLIDDSIIPVVDDGDAFLILTGEFNIAYAKQILSTTERISVSMIENANQFSDVPAVLLKDRAIRFDDDQLNCASIEKEGTYVFDGNYASKVTPATDMKRVDIVIINDIVVSVSKEGNRTLIPSGSGFVISLVGDEAVAYAEEFAVGEKCNTCYIKYTEPMGKYIKLGDTTIPLDKFDVQRQPEGAVVLYSSTSGQSTNTNEYGVEVCIQNNTVVSVNVNKGNSSIPESGYVLSIHNASPYYSIVCDAKVGDGVVLEINGDAYVVSDIDYTGINEARVENSLIVYTGTGKTGTNVYGFEIAVDKDGYAVRYGSGNLEIPEGGYVLSGHGNGQMLLSSIYAYGERLILDEANKKVRVIKTPDLIIKDAANELAIISDKLDEAKKAFLNLDYAEIADDMSRIEQDVEKAEQLFDGCNYNESFSLANSIVNACEILSYKLIESKGVENRAVWYRAVEHNDAEVLNTVKKLKDLNVNTLYLETWYEGYCIGKKVDVEGVTTHPAHGNYDVLDGFTRICHENGIEVHCWVQNFFTGYFYVDGPQYYNPTFAPEKFGDKYLIDCNGKPNFYYSANGNYFIFLNPNDRECRDLVLSIYRELITKYDIDGIHLDYVRFPELNYGKDDFGYNQDIIDGFVQKTGITKDPRTLTGKEKQMWIQYRCDIVTSFMGEVYDLVQELNDDLWISAATYPDLNMAKNEIFQDVAGFVEKGYFDEIFSMSYGADNQQVLGTVRPYVSLTKDKAFYSSGLATFLETTQRNFALQLTEVEQAGADGVAVFSLNTINPATYQNQMTLGAFRDASVQVTKGAVTASAQMSYVIEKIDNISGLCSIITETDFDNIKKHCSDIKKFCDEFNFDTATIPQKAAWLAQTIERVNNLKASIIREYGDNEESNAVNCELEDLVYWLTLTAERLNK